MAHKDNNKKKDGNDYWERIKNFQLFGGYVTDTEIEKFLQSPAGIVCIIFAGIIIVGAIISLATGVIPLK